ncbi:MAG: hypothetical protein JW747_06620 [Candidatus Aminicenantes bacterium]|nr:hypothetical protein [Candidatus Aminicenantes bacterium]
MEESEILKKLPRAAAPPDFEARLMARLAERKGARTSGAPHRSRLWLAAVPAALLAVVVLVNVVFLRPPGSVPGPKVSEKAGMHFSGTGRNGDAVRIMEPLNYRQDMRRLSDEPETVYILESVSDGVHGDILY